MPKMALCIERRHAPVHYNAHRGGPAALPHHPLFWHTPTRLEDRATCETDESLLQLLPYVTLIRPGTIASPARVYAYSRGQAGGEDRLKGQLSIGLGGHMDDLPPRGVGLREWATTEALRELREEVGLDVDPKRLWWTERLICDPAPGSVGRVHVGLMALVHLEANEELGEAEADVIDGGQWLTLGRLFSEDVFPRLEPWSQAVALQIGAYRTPEEARAQLGTFGA